MPPATTKSWHISVFDVQLSVKQKQQNMHMLEINFGEFIYLFSVPKKDLILAWFFHENLTYPISNWRLWRITCPRILKYENQYTIQFSTIVT